MECGSSGIVGFWRPPMPPSMAALGELSVFETWAPPHRCGSWLRPKLLAPIGSSPGRTQTWFLLLGPFFFGSLWAENQGTGVTGDGGYRGAGMRWGSKTRRMGWLTRRRGRCPRTPARDSSPLDPRQGGMAPLGTAHLAGAGVGQRPETERRRKALRCRELWGLRCGPGGRWDGRRMLQE